MNDRIKIVIEYRPCMVKTEAEKEVKALFHGWETKRFPYYEIKSLTNELMTQEFKGFNEGVFAIVEYEDGIVHEVEPQNIRFVDNPMCEYAFPEKNKKPEKWKDTDWHCPECKDGIMRRNDSMILSTNPSQYQYKCDKCGHIEYPGRIEASELE